MSTTLCMRCAKHHGRDHVNNHALAISKDRAKNQAKNKSSEQKRKRAPRITLLSLSEDIRLRILRFTGLLRPQCRISIHGEKRRLLKSRNRMQSEKLCVPNCYDMFDIDESEECWHKPLPTSLLLVNRKVSAEAYQVLYSENNLRIELLHPSTFGIMKAFEPRTIGMFRQLELCFDHLERRWRSTGLGTEPPVPEYLIILSRLWTNVLPGKLHLTFGCSGYVQQAIPLLSALSERQGFKHVALLISDFGWQTPIQGNCADLVKSTVRHMTKRDGRARTNSLETVFPWDKLPLELKMEVLENTALTPVGQSPYWKVHRIPFHPNRFLPWQPVGGCCLTCDPDRVFVSDDRTSPACLCSDTRRTIERRANRRHARDMAEFRVYSSSCTCNDMKLPTALLRTSKEMRALSIQVFREHNHFQLFGHSTQIHEKLLEMPDYRVQSFRRLSLCIKSWSELDWSYHTRWKSRREVPQIRLLEGGLWFEKELWSLRTLLFTLLQKGCHPGLKLQIELDADSLLRGKDNVLQLCRYLGGRIPKQHIEIRKLLQNLDEDTHSTRFAGKACILIHSIRAREKPDPWFCVYGEPPQDFKYPIETRLIFADLERKLKWEDALVDARNRLAKLKYRVIEAYRLRADEYGL